VLQTYFIRACFGQNRITEHHLAPGKRVGLLTYTLGKINSSTNYHSRASLSTARL